MDSRAKQLLENGDNLFSKRGTLMSLWQEVADNFYPERADFVTSRSLGEDFAAHLNSSYPLIVPSAASHHATSRICQQRYRSAVFA